MVSETYSGGAAPPLMSERKVSMLCALFAVIGPVSMSLYTPAMTEIVHAFGTTESLVKMTLALYFAGFACAQLIAGPLSDSIGRRPVTIAFMGIYLAASTLALVAPDINTLLMARFLQGVGASAGIAISRAVVRDMFTHEQSARIMNLIGLILAAGPAIAPTIGGITMHVAGWRAIFVVMALLAMTVMMSALFLLKETVPAGQPRFNGRSLLASYRLLLGNGHFMITALIIGSAVGAIYAQATFLPFILMNHVGLTAAQFGLAMIAQSGSYFTGALVMRQMMKRMSAYRLVPVGLLFVGAGSLGQTLLYFWEPSFVRVMGPVALYAFGIAFVMPAISTACLAPFPKIAGTAAALMGFIQMGLGLVIGSIGAWMGDPVRAMGILIPLMGGSAISFYLVYRFHPHLAEPEPRGDILPGMPVGRTLLDEKTGGHI